MIKPRDMLITPNLFGRKAEVEWRGDVSIALMHSAEVQHRCAFLMRKNISLQFGSIKHYANISGQSYRRILSVLGGYIPISIEDIGQAVALLGLSVEFIDQYSQMPSTFAAKTFVRDAIGAFYTPDDIALLMVRKAEISSQSYVLEPSFGDGAFLRALKKSGVSSKRIIGCEIDPAACTFALSNEYLHENGLYKGDFLEYQNDFLFDAVIGNPPYVRLRSLGKDRVQPIIEQTARVLGEGVGKESSLWLPFILKAAEHVRDGGGIAFVLPFEFTYVKYARSAWEYLGHNFDTIEVLRSKERLFDGILQDVILFFAKGKGGETNIVSYCCYETRQDLLEDSPYIKKNVSLQRVCAGDRAFQEALIDQNLLKELTSSPFVLRAKDEAFFRIGYVCGNKRYFHPNQETIGEFNLPEKSLRQSISSSRQLSRVGLFTSMDKSEEKLWVPEDEITSGEHEYIKFGERSRINQGYKCRIRNPWWKVPGVQTPDSVMSVFGGVPLVMINDGSRVVSNSLLGIYLRDEPVENFCGTWYSLLTLLSIELQIHFLGGGVLVAVPNEAGNVLKLASTTMREKSLSSINSRLKAGAVMDAYRVNDELLKAIFGKDTFECLEKSINLLREWRKG